MSSVPMMSAVLLVSSIMCFFMNSWVSIWIMLEMNTLAFCCMMKSFSTEKKMNTESSMKYFIIQSVASAMLIFSSCMTNLSKSPLNLLLMLSMFSLMIKMAATPFHQWFIGLTKKMMWKNSTTLLTWQKIAPVFLLIYQMKWFVFPFMIMSATVGSISQMNKINVMEIMAFSSIFNLSWMMLALMMNTKLLLMFSTIYWTSVIMAMLIIYTTKMKKINSESNDKTKKWMYLMVILNLAGIPPLAGFLAKWIVFSEGIVLKMYFLITLLLISSSVNLYIYMRVMNFFMTKNSDKTQKSNKQVKKSIMQNVTVTSIFPLGIISL